MSVRAILKVKGSDVVTVRTDTPAKEAVATMAREKIGSVVVTDDGKKVVGILSERDIIRALDKHGANLLTLTAGELMTLSVTTATIDMHILDVLETMTAGRFRHMPVVENGRLAGMVSIGDAVKARLDMLESETTQLKDYIGGR
jgi:CBS domain-containing protein